ncbi:glutathione S-transferase [Mycena latifolia]|nr:glutathione S-transferase [Mycena latifolia]
MASKPIMLYTAGTPNGRKVSVFLEELKAAYKLEYDFQKIELGKNQQKEPWYIALNPNGRIPVIIDRARDDFPVFETAAILLYLEDHYDQEFKFAFDPATQPKEYSQMLQWIFWAHGGLGPMMACSPTGQAGHFTNLKELIPYAKGRYVDEAKRLLGVLEIGLKDREYLVGGKFTLADINAQPWVAGHKFCGIESLDEWPNLKRWFDNIAARDAVKAGFAIP